MTFAHDAISSAELPELDADADLEARMVEVFDNVIRLEESENEPEFNLPLTTDTWSSHHPLACSSPLTPSSSEHATDESSQRQLSPPFSFDSFDSFDPQISFELAQLAIMAPNSAAGAILQGLNLVHSPNANPQASSDAQDLLSSAAYADLSQLDLWTNVAFASDEPYVPPSDLNSDDGEEKDGKSGDSAATALSLKKKRDFLAKNPPNVQRQLLPPPNGLGGNSQEGSQQQHATVSNPAPAVPATAATPLFPPTTPAAYDFGSLLAMSGHQISPEVMNLNQLLFANPFGQAHAFHQFPQFQHPLAPLAPVPPTPATTSTPTAATPQSPHESTNPPPAKKPRSRKASTAVAGSQAQSSTIAASERRPNPVSRSPSVDPHDDMDETSAEPNDPSKPMTPAEDKRRRNTAASARFRAKKKEREHAMESRCKDLESKVGDLERECEALRRENGWLKGLVVGVTGGTGMPIAMPGGPGLPTIPPPQQVTSNATAAAGSKRKRDTTSESTS
ncbi:hypothetical protein FRC01_007447 [Tulasnella sp. 417]|nr:hypothetical protein FRC01_007447 [Tulasnella sp. 417]